MSGDFDVKEFEGALSQYTVEEVRAALDEVGEHPLRGAERGHAAYSAQGTVKDGEPQQGVRVRYRSRLYHFELTSVAGDRYARQTLSMGIESFTGFAVALLDLLTHGR
jgi:hypothetical protein